LSTAFNFYSYAYKKVYVEWINEAKTVEPRSRRMKQATKLLVEDKGLKDEYAVKKITLNGYFI
jgi:uncharacterized protein YdeI (YjbR/CyaY-like superfamily)